MHRSVIITVLSALPVLCVGTACGSWLSPVQVTDNTCADQVPVANAQGNRIAFYSDADGDDDIYFVEYRRGVWQPPVLLTANSTSDTMPAINDAGDKIAYICGPPNERSIYS